MNARLVGLVVLGACLVAADVQAGPWEDLMGPGKPKLWTDPLARFYLDLPIGWKPKPREDGPFVDFFKDDRDRGQSAHVQVEMRTLPPNVNTRHFAVRVHEDLKQKAPQYRVISERRVRVSGVPAIRTHFTYQVQNNAALVNEVDQAIFIIGERAFIVTMETRGGARQIFHADFNKMLKGFTGRAPGEESRPMPKRRRRVKSGEMVNPDAVSY